MKISNMILSLIAATTLVSGCKKTYKEPREFAEKYVLGEIERKYSRDFAGFKGVQIASAELFTEALPMHGTLEKVTCIYYPELDPNEKYYYPLDNDPKVLEENNLTIRKNYGIGYFSNLRSVIDEERFLRLQKRAKDFLNKPPKLVSELPEISIKIMKNPAFASGKVEVYRTKNSDGIYVPMKLAEKADEIIYKQPCAVVKDRVWSESTARRKGYIVAITFSGEDKAPVLSELLDAAEKEGRKVTRKDLVGNEIVTQEARLAVDTFNSKFDELKTREEEINKLSIEIENFNYREKNRRNEAQRQFEAKCRQELEAPVKELEKQLSSIDPDPMLVRGRRGVQKISALHTYDEKLGAIAKDRQNTESKIQKTRKNRDKDLSLLANMQNSLGKNPRNAERIRRNMADTEARIAEAELNIANCEAHLRDLADEEDAVRQERTAKESELKALKDENQRKIAALNEQISAKKTENKQLFAQKSAAFAAEWEAENKKKKDELLQKLEYNILQVEELVGIKSRSSEPESQQPASQEEKEGGFGWIAL